MLPGWNNDSLSFESLLPVQCRCCRKVQFEQRGHLDIKELEVKHFDTWRTGAITPLKLGFSTTIVNKSFGGGAEQSTRTRNIMQTTMTETMKAVRIHSFGGPEVLQFEETPRPEPGARQVLVRVHAAGVNPVDWKIREGKLGQIPLPSIMGSDFSGEIEALGPRVEEFRVGEMVFGSVADESSSYAQYCLAPIPNIVEKPKQIDHVAAAAITVPAMTAWQALFDEAKLSAGQRVLIHAASGGVGNFAVQFAKWKGAYVIGTASGANAELVRSLGADEFIDYRSTRFEDVVHDVDVVFDTIGGDTQERSWNVLKKG